MTIITNTTDRKALAKAIADELSTTSRYMGMPTCGYQIGDFVVDADGNIVGEDFTALQDFLTRNGYEIQEQEADQEIPALAQPAEEADPEEPAEAQPEDSEETDASPAKEEAPADSEAEPITQMDVLIPARDVTIAQLKNLTYMLYARQTLINRMTQSDCLNIPEILIQRLADAEPESPEAFTDLLDDCRAMEGLTGFDFRDGKVSMTFPFDEAQPEKWTTYANLLNRIYDAAVKATRVFPERVEPNDQNEKYLAHVWLQRLGYHGPDFKAERKILLGHLTGYCAFANGDKMQAHKDKFTAIRRERRLAEQEASVMEVMVEEANTDE